MQRRDISTFNFFYWLKNYKFTKNGLNLSNGRMIYHCKQTLFQIDKTAKLNINGNLVFNDTALSGMKRCSLLKMEKNSKLVTSGKFRFFYGADIYLFEGSTLNLGSESYINSYCKIRCKNDIKIGNGCAIGPDFLCIDSDWHSINGSMKSAPIVIGNHVWIGARVTVLSGVNIRR